MFQADENFVSDDPESQTKPPNLNILKANNFQTKFLPIHPHPSHSSSISSLVEDSSSCKI